MCIALWLRYLFIGTLLIALQHLEFQAILEQKERIENEIRQENDRFKHALETSDAEHQIALRKSQQMVSNAS